MKLIAYLRSHRQILTVGAVFALIYMGNGSYSPFLALYYKQIGLSVSQIGIITAIGPFAALIFQTAWGRLADRTNRKFVLMLTLITSGLCALLYLLHTSYWYILMVALLFVIFNTSVLPMSDALALEFCSKKRYRFAPIRICGTIGFAIMPVLLGDLFSDHLNYIFPVFFIMCITASIVSFFFPTISNERRILTPATTVKAPKKPTVSIKPLLKDPLVIFLLISNFVISVGVCAYTFLPLYASSLGFDTQTCGLLNAVAALSEIPSLLIIDAVLRKVKGQHIIVASSFFCALRLTLTYVAGFCGSATLTVLMLAQCLQSVSYITNYYCSAQLIHEKFPDELKSTAQTLLAMISAGFSRIVGSIVGGYLSDSIGLGNTFAAFAVFLLFGSFVVLLAQLAANKRMANVNIN